MAHFTLSVSKLKKKEEEKTKMLRLWRMLGGPSNPTNRGGRWKPRARLRTRRRGCTARPLAQAGRLHRRRPSGLPCASAPRRPIQKTGLRGPAAPGSWDSSTKCTLQYFGGLCKAEFAAVCYKFSDKGRFPTEEGTNSPSPIAMPCIKSHYQDRTVAAMAPIDVPICL